MTNTDLIIENLQYKQNNLPAQAKFHVVFKQVLPQVLSGTYPSRHWSMGRMASSRVTLCVVLYSMLWNNTVYDTQ